MKYRKSFFENFLLRISPGKALNDPFELTLNRDSPGVQKALDRSGLISFGKYPPDIKNEHLMWGHYGDSHNGIAIIFNKDKLPNSMKNSLNAVNYKPDRDHALPVAFCKHESWAYENEIRIHKSMYDCDEIWIHDDWRDTAEKQEYCDKILHLLREESSYKVYRQSTQEENKNKCQNSVPNVWDICNALLSDKRNLFMLKLDPASIQEVHLGHLMSEENQREVKKLVKKFNSDAVVYKMKLSSTSYELEKLAIV